MVGSAVLALAGVGGCGSNTSAPHDAGGADAADAAPPLAPELGTGDHSPTSVTFTVIANASNKLARPRDLAFNPRRPDEAWVVNHDTESVTIIHDASAANVTIEWRKDVAANAPGHFMAYPSAITFGGDVTSSAPMPVGVGGKPGTFATVGESRNTYDNTKAANDFMGPALWSSDLTIFAKYDPNGLGSHLEMSHCSPLGMGIAHDPAVDSTGRANTFWVFSGMARQCGPTCGKLPVMGVASIEKYNFNGDNGVGNDDHSAAQAWQYTAGTVSYVPNVPSHMVYNPDDAMLYIADTGNQRIAKLDTKSGTPAQSLQPPEPMTTYKMMSGVVVSDVVAASTGQLQAPSGLKLRNGFLYVTDNATSRISAFTLDGTTLVNYVDTGLPPGSLAGLDFGGVDGKIYFVDMIGNQVLRIDPP